MKKGFSFAFFLVGCLILNNQTGKKDQLHRAKPLLQKEVSAFMDSIKVLDLPPITIFADTTSSGECEDQLYLYIVPGIKKAQVDGVGDSQHGGPGRRLTDTVSGVDSSRNFLADEIKIYERMIIPMKEKEKLMEMRLRVVSELEALDFALKQPKL